MKLVQQGEMSIKDVPNACSEMCILNSSQLGNSAADSEGPWLVVVFLLCGAVGFAETQPLPSPPSFPLLSEEG